MTTQQIEQVDECPHPDEKWTTYESDGSVFDDHVTLRGKCRECGNWYSVAVYGKDRQEFAELDEKTVSVFKMQDRMEAAADER